MERRERRRSRRKEGRELREKGRERTRASEDKEGGRNKME